MGQFCAPKTLQVSPAPSTGPQSRTLGPMGEAQSCGTRLDPQSWQDPLGGTPRTCNSLWDQFATFGGASFPVPPEHVAQV